MFLLQGCSKAGGGELKTTFGRCFAFLCCNRFKHLVLGYVIINSFYITLIYVNYVLVILSAYSDDM
jgi:hypothetical protein